MTGWLILAGLAAAAAMLLWALRMPRALWSFVGAALMLGGAGYAWQGSPGLAGHPIAAQVKRGEVDPEMKALREAMFGRFNFTDSYFVAADGMTRAGYPQAAAQWMLAGVTKAPQDAGLWTGLGLKIAEQDGNMVSPASQYAFDRALQLAPKHPGPPFFLGLALVRGGQFAEARPWWARALELTPKNASYRDQIAARLFLLDRFLTLQAEAQRQPQPQPER